MKSKLNQKSKMKSDKETCIHYRQARPSPVINSHLNNVEHQKKPIAYKSSNNTKN